MNGNRLGESTSDGVKYTPVKQGSNHYVDYVYDKSGKTLDDGKRTYGYNSVGRLEMVGFGSVVVRNVYNGLGQRVSKTVTNGTIYSNYDESGLLIGEYDSSGNIINEFVYLGHQPIALLNKVYKAQELFTQHNSTLP